MGNFIRFVLFLFVILAGVTVLVFQHKPHLLVKVDSQLQYWYKKPYQNEHNAIKELPMPEGRAEAVQRLEDSLKDLADTRLGDNRFPIWRGMVQMLSGHYHELGNHEESVALLRRSLKVDPHNLEMRSDLVLALANVGTGEALAEAEENLEFIRYRFPVWSKVASLELSLALNARDGKAIAIAMVRSREHGRRDLLGNWQVFLFPNEGKHTKSELTPAHLESDSGIARATIDLDIPEGGAVRFRLDPPTKIAGIVRDWEVILRGGDGQELARKSGDWDSTVRTEVQTDGALLLKGESDPQWILRFEETLVGSGRMQVEFSFHPETVLPPEVEVALQDPMVRAAFDAHMEDMQGSGGQE